MRRKVATSLAAAVMVALSGCGTSLNLDGDSRIYGGVAQDVQEARERLAQADNPSCPDAPGSSPAWNRTLATLACADVPLSLVGDTLTLPLTFLTEWEERHDPDSSSTKTDSGGAKAANPRGTGGSPGHPRPVSVSMGW
jgi:uncharacterized protein YceK